MKTVKRKVVPLGTGKNYLMTDKTVANSIDESHVIMSIDDLYQYMKETTTMTFNILIILCLDRISSFQ